MMLSRLASVSPVASCEFNYMHGFASIIFVLTTGAAIGNKFLFHAHWHHGQFTDKETASVFR